MIKLMPKQYRDSLYNRMYSIEVMCFKRMGKEKSARLRSFHDIYNTVDKLLSTDDYTQWIKILHRSITIANNMSDGLRKLFSKYLHTYANFRYIITVNGSKINGEYTLYDAINAVQHMNNIKHITQRVQFGVVWKH